MCACCTSLTCVLLMWRQLCCVPEEITNAFLYIALLCFISSPATAQLIHKKGVTLGGKRASFLDKAEELTLNLSDALDRCAKWVVVFFQHTDPDSKQCRPRSTHGFHTGQIWAKTMLLSGEEQARFFLFYDCLFNNTTDFYGVVQLNTLSTLPLIYLSSKMFNSLFTYKNSVIVFSFFIAQINTMTYFLTCYAQG